MGSADMLRSEYRRYSRRKIIWICALAVLAVFMFFITLGFGVYDISVTDAIGVFFAHIMGGEVDEYDDLYIWDTRFPRALSAIITGAALSVAGAVMQNDFRNPLAEPYTMGLSSGAFLGAVLSIVSGISLIPVFSGSSATMANAFVCSLIPTAIIVLVSAFRKLTPTAMILVGIAVMFMFNSICQMILVTAPSESLADAYSWRVGDLGRVNKDDIPLMAAVSVFIIVAIWSLSGRLNVMYAGDRGAQSLGENAGRIRISTLILVSFLTASVVCFTGTIGFIGLVGPHVARIFVGSDNRYLIPASAVFGAAFLLFADTIAKVSGPNGLPVGVVSAIIGAPLFIYILVRQRKSAWA